MRKVDLCRSGYFHCELAGSVRRALLIFPMMIVLGASSQIPSTFAQERSTPRQQTQAARMRFNIPPQALDSALNIFIAASDWQIQ